MGIFGDEMGLLWHEKGAGARSFVQGCMNPWFHDPGVESVDEDEKELDRSLRRIKSLRAQTEAEVARAEQILARIRAKPAAAEQFARGEDLPPSLRPKCEAAIAQELRADARDVLAKADMQLIPELRARFADAGLKLVRASGRGEGVRMELLLPRDLIGNLPPQPTEPELRRKLTDAIATFQELCPNRSKVVAAVKAAVARVIARFGLGGTAQNDQQEPYHRPSPREIAAAHFQFSPLQPAAP
jgi:hypothetical protein